MAEKARKSFGTALREKRVAKELSLRKFAALVNISPTYLSQIEQGTAIFPTAERVQKMAEVLEEDADTLIAMAGRVPGDLPEIILKRPTEMPQLLREASGLTAEQLTRLVQQARRLKGKDV